MTGIEADARKYVRVRTRTRCLRLQGIHRGATKRIEKIKVFCFFASEQKTFLASYRGRQTDTIDRLFHVSTGCTGVRRKPPPTGRRGSGHRMPTSFLSVREASSVFLPVAPVILVAGCSPAPSQDILGSFFPSWLLCAALGVIIALLCRRLLTVAGIGEYLVAAPLVYFALAASAALLIWLVRFGG